MTPVSGEPASGRRGWPSWFSPVWLVLGSISSVQIGSVIAKSLFGQADPMAIAWLRMVIALPILFVVARPRVRGRTRAEWAAVLVYGAALAVMNASIYQSFARIPVGLAVTIEFLGPLGVAFSGIRRARDLVWVALAAAGVVILGWSPVVWNWAGIGFALLAAAGWAGYIVAGARVSKTWDGISGVTVGQSVGVVGFAVPGILAGGTAMWHPVVLGTAAAVAVLSTVIPYALEIVALRHIKASVFGILMSLEPAVAALAALIVLHEMLAPAELVAMACVIVASIGATRTMGRSGGHGDVSSQRQ